MYYINYLKIRLYINYNVFIFIFILLFLHYPKTARCKQLFKGLGLVGFLVCLFVSVFECLLHYALFEEKYSQNSNIVKYYTI